MRYSTAGVIVVALTIVVIDQITKWWALQELDDGHIIELVGSLQLNLAFNRGSAFSLGEGFGPLIGVLALVVAGALIWIGRRAENYGTVVATGAVAGGAIGNFLDRLFREGDGVLGGAVVDFIDLQWWPIFNVADMAITVGAVAFVFFTSRTPA